MRNNESNLYGMNASIIWLHLHFIRVPNIRTKVDRIKEDRLNLLIFLNISKVL